MAQFVFQFQLELKLILMAFLRKMLMSVEFLGNVKLLFHLIHESLILISLFNPRFCSVYYFAYYPLQSENRLCLAHKKSEYFESKTRDEN